MRAVPMPTACGDFDLTLGGRIQLRYTYENFDRDRDLKPPHRGATLCCNRLRTPHQRRTSDDGFRFFPQTRKVF